MSPSIKKWIFTAKNHRQMVSPIPEIIQKILVTPPHPLYGAFGIWRPHYWHKCLKHKIPRRSYNSKKNEDLAKRYLIVFFYHKTLLFTRFVSEKFYTLKKVSLLNMWKTPYFRAQLNIFLQYALFIYITNFDYILSSVLLQIMQIVCIPRLSQ